MKKILLSAVAVLGMVSSASAADLAARPYTKAPVVAAPVYNWTGFYVGGGAGYSFLNNDNYNSTLGGVQYTQEGNSGARGWLGTVQVGFDYQFGGNWVIGAFADYTWADIKGNNVTGVAFPSFIGEQKLDSSWAAGGRLGYSFHPMFLGFVSAGYTQAHFDGYTMAANVFPAPAPALALGAITRDGWFIGTGYETQLSFIPGLTWKTEYRFSDFGKNTNVVTTFPGGAAFALTTEDVVSHTVRSTLSYRFNWGR